MLDLTQMVIPYIGLNLVDIIIVIVIVFYGIEGYFQGVAHALLDLVSLALSFVIGLKAYTLVSSWLVSLFAIPIGFAHAGGFFLSSFVSEVLLSLLLRYLYHRFLAPRPTASFYTVYLRANHLLGIIPGIGSAVVILSFLLSTIMALPSSPVIKKLIASSQTGAPLIAATSGFEKSLNEVFAPALHDTLNFLTIEPQSNETVELKFTVKNGTVDANAEAQMLAMVNKERTSRGIAPLVLDPKLRSLARSYSEDMFKRGYFSHYNPEGQDPFDRMQEHGITYSYAGENLALAPSTDLAMQGLMNSPGHRENILNPHFRKVGIGVIDGGIYGKMFTQEFTD